MRDRWRSRGEARAPAPSLTALWARCRSFRAALFDEGGASIETPDPVAGPAAVFARTLVQPDGDVVCFVTERYEEDAGLRLEHRQRCAAWFGDLHATLDGVAATRRAATRWISLVVVALTTLAVSARSTLVVGVLVGLVTSVAVPAVVRQGLRFVIGRLLSRPGRPA